MDTDFDPTALAARFVQHNADRFLSFATSGVKGVATQVRARLDSTYQSYIEQLLERYGKGKSFFVRSESVPLYDFFVPLDLITQVRRLSGPSILDVANVSPCAIISGSGGSGKSMMMRHLLVDCILTKQKTPIFLELRQLNQTAQTLTEALLEGVQSAGLNVDADVLAAALKAGQFAVLLDGFDEVERSSRKRIASEIRLLTKRYPKNWFILSSRPDTALQGWDEFVEYNIAPLTLEKAELLVRKLPFDELLKERFVSDLRGSLFANHGSFLSNPLLLSIMLLTYSDVAHIPHKLSTFYSQAYEALFYRHGALKSGYQRERVSCLDIQDYSRAFSAFSLLSYDKREFSFTYERALALIGAAREASMLSYDDKAFLDDAVQAICLLLEEGLAITFAHRSFQEYFVARYIQLSPPEIKAKLVERFIPNAESDAVLSLLWELDQYVVEKYYLLPRLAKIREMTGAVNKVGLTHLHRFVTKMVESFSLTEGAHVSGMIGDIEMYVVSAFVAGRYGPPETDADNDRDLRALRLGFREEFGDVEGVQSSKLKVRGPFLRAIANSGGLWKPLSLERILRAEREIQAKHAANRESIEKILSSHRRTKHR